MPGAFSEAVTVGETFDNDNAQKPRTENFFWKAALEAANVLVAGGVEQFIVENLL